MVSGCGPDTVQVSPPQRAGSAACARVGRHWPAKLGSLQRRTTSSNSPAVAAWGDPPVIARCGVTSPGPTTATCIQADGVDWVARKLSDGYAFLSFGRSPAIQVLVPHAYAPEPLRLAALSAAARTIPQTGGHCS